MHAREEAGIAVETAQELGVSFAWVSPLSTEPCDADDLLASPDSVPRDKIDAESAAL
jgi:hypothetical protein